MELLVSLGRAHGLFWQCFPERSRCSFRHHVLEVDHTFRYLHDLGLLILRRLALFAHLWVFWRHVQDLGLILVGCWCCDRFNIVAMCPSFQRWLSVVGLEWGTQIVGQRSFVVFTSTSVEAFAGVTVLDLVFLLVSYLDQNWPEIVVACQTLLIVRLVVEPCWTLVPQSIIVCLYADFLERGWPIHLEALLAWLPLFLAHGRCIDATLWLTQLPVLILRLRGLVIRLINIVSLDEGCDSLLKAFVFI